MIMLGSNDLKMLKIMLSLQDEINSKINPQWRSARNPWYRAMWTECAEMLDHVGWKWWKKKEQNIAQMRLEVIDIWHFGLSEILEKLNSLDDAADAISKQMQLPNSTSVLPADELINLVESFASKTLASKEFDAGGFARILTGSGMTLSDLYIAYVQKNILNKFRQDKGYAKGSYIKMWRGREDNEWLIELSERLDFNSPNYPGELYQTLDDFYRQL
jgi:dimeric dUTPase (all-alpha-NTP-PPase superfamily)